MPQADADKWNNIYRSGAHGSREACQVLSENIHLLPKSGKALDLACGMGGNAILLGKLGLVTCAWDISATAITKLDVLAKQQRLEISTEVIDVIQNPPLVNSFDVIVVSRFLERRIIPDIKHAIRTGGLIFYQTFCKERVDDTGPKNPDYLLNVNELLGLFDDFRVLFYREEGTTGDCEKGCRNEAMLVAQKRT